MNHLPETGFMRLRQIIGDRKKGIPAIIPVGPTTWWNGVRTGRFPKSYKLGKKGAGATAWKVEDIKKLLEGFSK